MKVSIISFLALITFLFSGCYYDNFGELKPDASLSGSNCDTASPIKYSTQIVPLLEASCTSGCHNGFGSGHNMKNYAALNADVVSGAFLGAIQWITPFQQMPQGATSKISDCDIAKVRLWIAQGAPNN